MEERLYIEFGEEHYNPLGIIRSLGESGIKPIAIILNKDYKLASNSKYISKLHRVNTIQEGYELLLKEYGNENVKPILYTTDDQVTSFLDKHYDEIKDKFIFFNAGENGRISYYMNKDNINKLAIKHGLNVAKSWIVDNPHEGGIPEDIEYPVMTKAIISTIDHWKDDVFICHNSEELKEAYKSIKSEKVLLQKYIQKKNELCIDGYSVAKGKKVFYAIATNYLNIVKNAYSNYMIVKNCNYADIENKLSNMFKEIGFEGIFSVEFLIDENDNYYFLEINFRNSTWSYASTKAGMNLPILWSKAMEDESVVENSYKEFKDFKAMAEFTDYKDRVKTKEISFIKWIWQLLGCKCLYFINLKDMRPMYKKVTQKISKKFKKGNKQ